MNETRRCSLWRLMAACMPGVALLLLAVPTRAATITSEVIANLALSGGSHTYQHDINALGFNPGAYSITDASLTLYFFDDGFGTNDNVSVDLDGSPSGTVTDPPGFALEAFQGTLSVPASFLQVDGLLSVSLYPGKVIFQRSVLEVNTAPAPLFPPPGKMAVTLFSEIDPEPNLSLSGGPHSFAHDIIPLGFNPLTDSIERVSLTLWFVDSGAGTDDSVEIRFDGGVLGGIAHDTTASFLAGLNVPPGLLQSDGNLAVTLSQANALFDRSVLEVHLLRDAAVPEPSTAALLGIGSGLLISQISV